MADQANITSWSRFEAFRANLIVFLNKAHTRLDEVGMMVRRTKSWASARPQAVLADGLCRRRTRLDQAEQELLTARMSSLRENHTLQMMASEKAKEALQEARRNLRM